MHKIVRLLLLTILLLPFAAKGEIVIDITQGYFRPTPIAVTNFGEGGTQESQELGDKISEVVMSDLAGCGLFEIVDPNAYIQHGPDVMTSPRYQDWRILNAEALVGGVVNVNGGQIDVSFRLFDVFSERELSGQRMASRTKDWRRVAHQISDVIYERLTGDKGYFDTHIAYISEKGSQENRSYRMAIMDQDGENHAYLTSGHNEVQTPRFSSSGKFLAYLERDKKTKNTHIRVMDLASGKTQMLGPFEGVEVSPRFSPDGRYMLLSIADNGTTSIYEIDLQTKEKKRLTKSIGSIDITPCYSPDGKRIVYVSDRAGSPKLYIKTRDFGPGERVSFGEGIYLTPVWSPRGDQIAFIRRAHGNNYIGVMRPDGTGERMLTRGALLDTPEWSPNGRRLIFSRSDGPGRPYHLHSVDLTGYNEKLHPTPEEGTTVAWSPLIQD